MIFSSEVVQCIRLNGPAAQTGSNAAAASTTTTTTTSARRIATTTTRRTTTTTLAFAVSARDPPEEPRSRIRFLRMSRSRPFNQRRRRSDEDTGRSRGLVMPVPVDGQHQPSTSGLISWKPFSPRHQLQHRHGRLNSDVMRRGRLAVVCVTERITDPGHGFVNDRGPQGCMRGA